MFELKRCPCCGGEAKLRLSKTINFYDNGYQISHLAEWVIQVMCTECRLETSRYTYIDKDDLTIEEILATYTTAIDNWNARLNDDDYMYRKELHTKVRKIDHLEVLLNYGLTQRAYRWLVIFIKYESNGWTLKTGIPKDYQVKISDLTGYTRIELKRGRRIGDKTIQNIVDTLAKVGLSLKGEEDYIEKSEVQDA